MPTVVELAGNLTMKLFRKSVFLSVCHPERSEGPYHAWYFIERVPFSRDKVLGSAPVDSFCDFLNSFDTNFITGDYHEEKDSESCKPLVRKHDRRKPVPLRKLADYVVEP